MAKDESEFFDHLESEFEDHQATSGREARALAQRVLYENAVRAAEVLADIVNNSTSDSARLAAARTILSYAFKAKEDDDSWESFIDQATRAKEE